MSDKLRNSCNDGYNKSQKDDSKDDKSSSKVDKLREETSRKVHDTLKR